MHPVTINHEKKSIHMSYSVHKQTDRQKASNRQT